MLSLNKLSIELPNGVIAGSFDFSLEKGDLLYLFGPNGCGKSSLLHYLATNSLVKKSGDVTVNGRLIEEYFNAKKSYPVSLLFQKHDPADVLVSELYDIAFYNCCNVDLINGIDNIERTLGIDHLKKRSVNQLSGGERQKINFYSLLLYNPDVFLFDEPYNNLDVPSVLAINSILQDLRESKTMVIALHDPNHAFFHDANVGVYEDETFSLYKNIEDFGENGISKGYLKGLEIYEDRDNRKKFFAY